LLSDKSTNVGTSRGGKSHVPFFTAECLVLLLVIFIRPVELDPALLPGLG